MKKIWAVIKNKLQQHFNECMSIITLLLIVFLVLCFREASTQKSLCWIGMMSLVYFNLHRIKFIKWSDAVIALDNKIDELKSIEDRLKILESDLRNVEGDLERATAEAIKAFEELKKDALTSGKAFAMINQIGTL